MSPVSHPDFLVNGNRRVRFNGFAPPFGVAQIARINPTQKYKQNMRCNLTATTPRFKNIPFYFRSRAHHCTHVHAIGSIVVPARGKFDPTRRSS